MKWSPYVLVLLLLIICVKLMIQRDHCIDLAHEAGQDADTALTVASNWIKIANQWQQTAEAALGERDYWKNSYFDAVHFDPASNVFWIREGAVTNFVWHTNVTIIEK